MVTTGPADPPTRQDDRQGGAEPLAAGDGQGWEGPAVASGIGSLPGTDIDEACRLVAGELPDLPHLPELPARGPGSDLTGRAAALLSGLHVDLQPAGWRLVARPGLDEGRSAATLRQDLDAFELAMHGHRGRVKVQVAGPWTLAATLERTRGGKVLGDHGARRDLAQSLAEGVAETLDALARRIPGATLLVQLDEPALPAVLAGAIPTASGFGRLRPVAEGEAGDALRSMISRLARPTIVHCCAAATPFSLLARVGAVGLSFDLSRVGMADLPALGDAVDAATTLWIGAVPSLDPPRARAPVLDSDLVRRLNRFWRTLGFDEATARRHTVVTPSCGLAGASPPWARRAYELAVAAARAL